MNAMETIQYLRANGLTYCGRQGKLEVVHQLVSHIERESIPGIVIEAGVAMGGSACVIAKTKRRERRLVLYDVFEMLPPPSDRDDEKSMQTYQYFLSGQAKSTVDANYISHANDLLSFTKQNMHAVGIDPAEENISFVRGLYQNTLRVDEPVAFAHIDCDWYDSVVTCIERIADKMSLGGLMLFDDYHSFEGCRRAVDNWLKSDPRFRVVYADWTVAVERSPAS
jgi:predicted O-methyltransferase YrrM